MGGQLIDKVLARYPGVSPGSLNFPPEAEEWDEAELDLFIGSGGFLKPKKKKKAPDQALAQSAGPSPAAPASLKPLEPSVWWVNKPNPNAKVRVFCAMGIGSVASTYGNWVSKEVSDAYPEIEVCVVEYPGHGTNFEESLGSVEEAAEALERELRRCHGSGADGAVPPFALFGFSMGANVMYRVAQRLGRCSVLYLAGRGPPHLPAPVRDAQAPRVAKVEELLQGSDVRAVTDALLNDVFPIFMAEKQIGSYRRIMESQLSTEKGCKDIRRLARSLVADCRIGMEANDVDRKFDGEICFYHSRADETWPPAVEGQYEELARLWEPYTTGKFTSEEVEPVSHDALGKDGSPIFQKLCQDLARRAAEGSL